MTLEVLAPAPLDEVLRTVPTIVRQTGQNVFLVGGPVRDALLGIPVSDVDLLVERDLDRFARALASATGASLRHHERFMTASLSIPGGYVVDLTTARREHYPSPGALPVVEEGASVEEDLARRDFTINALALDLTTHSLIDPHGGRDDLRRGLIRALHDQSFVDDPTRILRAVRFASRFELDLEPGTRQALDAAIAGGALRTVTPRRVWREITKAYAEPRAGEVFELLASHGILSSWLGSSATRVGLEQRIASLAATAPELAPVDEELLLLALLLENFRGARLPIELSHRRKRLLGELIDRRDGRLRIVRDGLDRSAAIGMACELSSEEALFLCLFLDTPHSAELISLVRRCRDVVLPFDAAALDLPPGPHIGHALREAKIRMLLGETEAELLPFARRIGLRYLSDEDE